MPRVRPPVDLETVLVGYLETSDVAELVGGSGNAARVSTELPSTFRAEARVKLNRSGGGVIAWPDHLDRALVTFHAYGATGPEAWDVAAALVVALAELEGQVVDGGVVTATERTVGPAWLPDPDARDAPRYVVEYALTAHPRP